MHLKALRTADGSFEIDAYDAQGLFDKATAALTKGDCNRAVQAYERLIAEFADSSTLSSALFNRGLCLEQLERPADAAASYEQFLARGPDRKDTVDALFRAQAAYTAAQQPEAAIAALNRLLSLEPAIEGVDKVETLARKGELLVQVGRLEDAEVGLKDAMLLHKSGRGIPEGSSSFYLAMAQFYIGEIRRAQMRSIALPADENAAQAVLEAKCQKLLDAQEEFSRAIRIAHPHWAAAAAYRIGGLYRELWDDLLGAPIPADLDEEQAEVYREVLSSKLRVLLEKAVLQWERTLKMARRLDLGGEWVERTSRDLNHIRAILNPPEQTESH
jgi:tetratricopeptide (TPR) repeat protein